MSKAGKIGIMAAAMLMPLQCALAQTGTPTISTAIPLYGNRTPGSSAIEVNDSALFGHPGLRNVTSLTLTPVLRVKGIGDGAAAVVLPGGDFMRLSMDEAGHLSLADSEAAAQKTSTILMPGERYVAMGSSYAAGAGIGPLVPSTPQRCGRTDNNYPHLLAARMGLHLVDVSCGGAMTAHILGRWNELPAQLDAVTSDTKLVTVTIGGNDLNYVRNLMIATCGKVPSMMPPAGHTCQPPTWPSDSDYSALEQRLRQIAQEVRRRAPQAKLVFIDYLRIVPDKGGCTVLPLDESQMAAVRRNFHRMAEVTARSAAAEGAILLPAGELSRGHDACSAVPWSAGYPGNPASWHPTASGHLAIADALARLLAKP